MSAIVKRRQVDTEIAITTTADKSVSGSVARRRAGTRHHIQGFTVKRRGLQEVRRDLVSNANRTLRTHAARPSCGWPPRYCVPSHVSSIRGLQP